MFTQAGKVIKMRTPHPKRIPFLVGNWKMHKTLSEARQDVLRIGEITRFHDGHGKPSSYQGEGALQSAVAPVALHLSELVHHAPRHLKIFAQNVHWETHGAFTGEHSAKMLSDLRVHGSIVAHSERRQFFGETNTTAGWKIRSLLNEGLEVIYCIGETAKERRAGQLKPVLEAQIREALHAAGAISLGSCIRDPRSSTFSIAYEPVWAIGTGLAATEKEAQEAHQFIREVLTSATSADFAQRTRILYGGSVKPENIGRFLNASEIDGALVGGASLQPESFAALCQAASKCLEVEHH